MHVVSVKHLLGGGFYQITLAGGPLLVEFIQQGIATAGWLLLNASAGLLLQAVVAVYLCMATALPRPMALLRRLQAGLKPVHTLLLRAVVMKM
jgi:hypothetical protein